MLKLRKPSILVVNWVSSWFSFFLNAFTAATYIFTACKTTIITLDPCALNPEIQHFIVRFNKNFITLHTPLKEGVCKHTQNYITKFCANLYASEAHAPGTSDKRDVGRASPLGSWRPWTPTWPNPYPWQKSRKPSPPSAKARPQGTMESQHNSFKNMWMR
jgi:hypothetical protein